MASDDLGLLEGVSMALGGMIGGGIYAVLGVVTQVTGAATWFAFILAGFVALCAGYSYNKLNAIADQNGGSVTFVQAFTSNSTLAGMAGWTLLFGYIGSMAMYAFAFAEFTISLPLIPPTAAGVSLRPLISIVAIGIFVALNLLGARVTGQAENVLVAAKVLVLVAFGLAGVAYAYLATPDTMRFGVSQLTTFNPIMAAGVSFVAFQGWQLLFYDQESVSDPVETIRTAVYISIPVAVAIYILIAVATFNLAPHAIQHHPHTALKDAAASITSVVGMAWLGGFVISLSALFSTGSAINATLFSSGYFAKGLLSKDMLPDRTGDSSASGVPERTILILGVITALFSAYGTLEAITNFASMAFIIIFGGMSLLALRNRDQESINPIPPLVGVVGSFAFLPLMLYHLFRADPRTFYLVFVLAGFVLAMEMLYFKREALEEKVTEVDEFPV